LIVLTIALGVGVVLLITAMTGYFVAQEFAFMSVDRSRLKARAEAGDAGAARALKVTRRTSFMLSGAQLGITVTGLLVGYVAEPLIGRGLGELLGGVGIPAGVGVAVGAVVAVVFSTFVQMLFGELFPKNLAIARPEPVARWLALSTTIYLSLFGWLIWLFDQSSNLLLRALRIEPVHDVEHSATARDLEHIVARSRDAGELPAELSALLDRILDFPDRTAEHAMVPRARVDTVGADTPVAQVLTTMGSGHTRYPVVGTTSDDLLGVIDLHDLLSAQRDGADAASCMREAVIVPTSLPLPQVVSRLVGASAEMALVVDEYGGFAGVITIEDIAEELVGDIADEHDDGHVAISGSRENGWTIAGDVHLDEVERLVGHRIPEGDVETLSGLVVSRFADFPAVNDVVAIPLSPDPADLVDESTPAPRLLKAQVLAVDNRVPSSLLVTITGSEIPS
jgi:CBS domain containing-hemolysin-like protein